MTCHAETLLRGWVIDRLNSGPKWRQHLPDDAVSFLQEFCVTEWRRGNCSGETALRRMEDEAKNYREIGKERMRKAASS